MVKVDPRFAANDLPLLVEPSDPRESAPADFAAWAESHRDWIRRHRLVHGGILFRGFALDGIDAFDRALRALAPALGNYVDGNSPRTEVAPHVYTSTEYSPRATIPLHSEMSYSVRPPQEIFFFCETPPRAGGETPVVDNRRILRTMDPGLRDRFERKKIKYVRNIHGGGGLGRSWQQTYETEDKAEVESYLRAHASDFEWTPSGTLRVTQVRDAVTVHPETGEKVWFNQADQWHSASLDPLTRETLQRVFKEDELPLRVLFGDDTPIPETDMKTITALHQREASVFPWRKGDLLLLDNYLVAHGRRPFTGPREILVAMA